MSNYQLESNETVLYKGIMVDFSGNEKRHSIGVTVSYELILTNLNIVFVTKLKKLLSKEEVSNIIVPINTIKIYEGKPQIKQKNTTFELYFSNKEYTFSLPNKLEAVKFHNKIMELVTGKSMSVRNSEKFKSAVELVDNTLGIDTLGTVTGVLQNGVKGVLFGGISKKAENSKPLSKKIINTVLDVVDNVNTTQAKGIEQIKNDNFDSVNDEKIETIRKLKSLLDSGALSQEEFDAKKKDILGL